MLLLVPSSTRSSLFTCIEDPGLISDDDDDDDDSLEVGNHHRRGRRRADQLASNDILDLQ